MAGQETVVHARKTATPRPQPHIGVALALAVAVVLVLVAGFRVMAVVVAVGAILVLPIGYFAARRAARQQPDWIEVRPDRIVAVRSTGASWELLRTPDSVLQVHELDGHPLLSMSGNGSIALGRFDVDEVGRAAVANGWPWTPAGGTEPIRPAPVDVDVPIAANETCIQLRDGETRLPQLMARFVPGLVVALAVSVAVAALAAGLAGVSPTVIVIALFGVSAVFGLTIAGVAIVSVGRSSLSISITPERVTLAHGTLASEVVQRSAIASATVGRRWARLRDPNGKALLWLPLRPRRDDVLNALARNGWPTSESPGGMRRHL